MKASRPVKLEITDIKYFYDNDGNAYTLQPKLIEGNIDAVLYHGNDSISIKGHFETKWMPAWTFQEIRNVHAMTLCAGFVKKQIILVVSFDF